MMSTVNILVAFNRNKYIGGRQQGMRRKVEGFGSVSGKKKSNNHIKDMSKLMWTQ